MSVTADSPLVTVNSAASGSVGGELPGNARALFYAPPDSRQPFFATQGALSQPQVQQQLEARAKAASASLTVRNLGVKWTALLRDADGLFQEVDPEQLKAGDVVKLRLVPNANGFLSVMEGSRPVVAERPVQRLEPFETPELTGAGKKELLVVLARQPQPAQKSVPPASGIVIRAADRSEHSVYEVSTGASPVAPVQVKITLNYQ